MNKQRFYNDDRFWFITITAIVALALYFFWDQSFLIRSVATVAFLALFYAGDRIYRIGFKDKHYIFFILIVVLGVLASPLYFIYPQYDKIQHLFMPMLMSAMTYYMINKLPLERKWKIWFTFFIVVALLGIFEICEYSIDKLFDFKLQGVYLRDLSGLSKFRTLQSPIDDTMMDLIFGTLGATIYGLYKSIQSKLTKQN